jgi:nitrilase
VIAANMPSIVRAAVVQDAGVPFDRDASLSILRQYVDRAVESGCDLVLFPEAFLGGYPRGFSFGTAIGSRSPDGREWFRRYHANAVEVGGPATNYLEELAAAKGIFIVVGIIERVGGTLFCSVVSVDPVDGIVGHRRKLMPTGAERIAWGSGDLSLAPVIRSRLGSIGTAICWENYMPLLRTYMYSRGVQIWCAPTADPRDAWVASMRHIAVEGRCFVLAANQFTRRSDFPDDYPLDVAGDTVLCDGASMIVDPLGNVLAGPHRDGPTMLVANLDLDEIPRAYLDFDAVGHYARGDLFTLEVNIRPTDVVRESLPGPLEVPERLSL